jgi:hypothetical protein
VRDQFSCEEATDRCEVVAEPPTPSFTKKTPAGRDSTFALSGEFESVRPDGADGVVARMLAA